MTSLLAFFVAHHAEIVYSASAFLAAVNVAITLALRLAPLTSWVAIAQRSPRIAALVRLAGSLGIDPVQVLQAIVDVFRGTTSPSTAASAKTLQTSASKPLIAPAAASVAEKIPS